MEKQAFSISRALKSTLKVRVRDCLLCLHSILYSVILLCFLSLISLDRTGEDVPKYLL